MEEEVGVEEVGELVMARDEAEEEEERLRRGSTEGRLAFVCGS